MNIMRKLLVGHARSATGEDPPQSAQHTALGLMHLHKLFAELAHSPHSLNQQEQEQRLYNMLPLFCKVFGNCPASDMMEKFSDILAFCQLVSRLMVSEIRRRASNQSTEAASCAIAKFLEIESTEERSNGWMLLTTLNLLAAGGAPLIEVMTSSSLPSTLVKCLYLFFDLPELENADELEPDSEFSPKERRILLQKVFMQVLVRLCSYPAPAEELARKDDLTLLFSAITSWCPPHNTAWRKSAAEVLVTVSRHGLTNGVVTYIHNKGCVGVCIENMQRVQELSPLEIVEMFVTVFCFLKDSSEVSQVLLDDFRSAQGYVFLSEFILRLEADPSREASEALRNLVLLVASLTTCGYVELKPGHASTGSLFHIAGFQLPMPSGRGASVRNIQAFQVLQSIFLKAQTPQLCGMLLDAISTVYHSDKANYFILESLHTLSQFAEKIHLKTPEIQSKFFSLLEFIVFELKFVPCKELISLSILLKTQSSVACCITCMQTLLNILRSNTVFKDVYREVGLLEVMVTCLHRYATLLKEAFPEGAEGPPSAKTAIPEEQQFLGSLVMEALTVLLSGNSNNANVFRECGGARCAHNLVPYQLSRQAALGIVQQLVLSNGGDDDMGTLLGMMHTAPTLMLDLKTHILKSLLHVLRESHRTRTVFRRVGGFVYVMSVLVSMEGCLADPPKPPWDTVEKKKVLTMLRSVFSTLTVAMRYEPANARFFASEICPTSLTDTVRLLGCFGNEAVVKPVEFPFSPQQETAFHTLFTCNPKEQVQHNIPKTLESVCVVMRLLYDMTLDAFDKPAASLVPQSPSLRSIERSGSVGSSGGSPVSGKRPAVASLNLTPPAADPIIVHPGVVVAMLHLLPSIHIEDNPLLSMTLQLYLSEVLRSLVRAERNQQVMCDAGLPGELLSKCQAPLENETHPLHHAFQYMLERLAAQSLEPRDLRAFLRLGSPLCCTPFDDTLRSEGRPANRRDGGPVPLTRVKTLVSMTTPRDFRLHGAAVTPPFVEFDMSSEGFGCLYLPSVAPQSASGPGVVGVGMVGMGSDASVVGGIGTGDRVFPPQPGLSFSTWLCVDKFSDPQTDPHSVRLLTVVRNVHNRDDHLICFSLTLSSRDKALLVSTQEIALPQTGGVDWEPEQNDESCVRIWTPELIQEGQWHHVVVVLNRAVLKNSSVSLYVDGQHVSTNKLHYISQNPGGGAANLIVTSSVYGFVGTPPHFRRQSRLVWKQGPCHLVEDVLSASAVASVFQLGPSYVGSLQAPIIGGPEPLGAFLPEEKVVFGINASAVSVMTLAKMRRVYSKVDCKSIAKMLGLSSHENATPIHVLHNSAGHLSGPARSLGGVLIGYLGARTFVPRPVSLTVQDVGGTAALLGLVAMAKDVEGLYAAVKALVCVVRSHRAAQQEMDRTRGYQTLAMLLKKKRPLLNSHILHLTFSLVGTIDSGRETTTIPNVASFKDLLCDLEVWREAPGDLQKSLYEHFFELVTESGDQKTNLRILRDLGMVTKLLQVLKEPDLTPGTTNVLRNLLAVLLHNTPRSSDVRCFGQFMAATLPATVTSERHISKVDPDKAANGDESFCTSAQVVELRCSCLRLLYALLFTGTKTINYPFCEEVIRILGFDWLLLFLQGHLHPSCTVWALKILVVLVSHPPLLQRFRDASSNGGWLTETEPVLQNRMSTLLGFNVGTTNRSREIRPDACQVPGFQHLQWLMTHHVAVTEVYLLLLMMLLCQPVKDVPSSPQLTLDTIWSFLFGAPTGHSSCRIAMKGELCAEAAIVLLSMVRTLLNLPSGKEDPCVQEYPVTIVQFLMFLYHNRQDFMHICMTADLLCALAATLFPLNVTWSEPSSEAASPVDDCRPFPGSDSNLVKSCLESSDIQSALTSHPARKFVMDFLRVIVVDSLSLPVATKQAAVIDLLLEACPPQASRAQQCEFQTELLTSLMEHLLAADVLLGEQAALPIASGGSYSNIAPNVFYFTSCLVDRLWQEMFVRDSHEVLDFILKMLTQAKRKGLQVSLDSINHSLNRTILYLLSRPMESVSDRMSTLECLQKIITHRNIILGPGNSEPDFFGCLCHCLLQLMDELQVSLETNRRTTWHVSSLSDLSGSPLTSAQEGAILVATVARNVWEELYNLRKQTLEDVCKVPIGGGNLGTTVGLSQAPDLHSLKDLLREPTGKLWANFLESERRSGYKESWQLHTQLQNRLQRVTGGLTRLASRRSRKETSSRTLSCSLSMQDVEAWTLAHISIVRDLVELQTKQIQQSQQHLQQYVFEEWLQTEAELTRERGLWGPLKGSILDKWMLDMTEGPCRMRKKMVKNENFYVHYPYRPEVEGGENKALKYKVATSFDSKEYYKRWRPENMVERDITLEVSAVTLGQDDSQEQEEEREIGFQGLRTASLLPRPPTNRSLTEQDEDQESMDTGSELGSEQEGVQGEQNLENQTVLRLLEEGEKISHMFRCARIQGLDTCEGLLLFGKEHFYVVDGFTLLKSREIRDIDSLPANMHDPIIPNTSCRIKRQKRMCSKFGYEDVREVHKRRYLLQPIALEVFSADGRNYLLAFPRKVRNKVYSRFLTVATAITDNAQESLSGQKRGANVESSAGLLSSLIGETSVTQRWVRGEISNFQYLMHLNTLAGRSYNDLMQYPVFPWVLADYESEELDLTDPRTFRDFSKPMGAQTPDRLIQFKKRYKEWDDPHGETPPYHYGTFYSSAMIVASYLVRMEPFTQHFLRLQGGHFDLADRMFHSVGDAWLSAAKHNMADVKELIPEFFYLPEFLINSNNFDLGCKQNGVQLHDVVLPPWAKGDPREFIRVHRQALECDYVSTHLNEWIDLIFGYKQQGQAAVDAVNVFHHLFYEGNVDIYSIEDPLKKNAAIGFINNFGQIPKQLFKKPHPCKKLANNRVVVDPGPIMPGLSCSHDKLFFHNLDNLRPSMHPVKELKGPVGQIIQHEKALLAVEQNKVLLPPTYMRYVAWGFADHSLRMGPYESERAAFVWEDLPGGEVLCCTCPNSKTVITAGTSSVVTVWQLDKKRLILKQNLHGHTEPVTCLAASSAYGLIVSGSRDRTCIIWDLNRLIFVRQLGDHPAPVAAVAINDLTGDIATCAGTYLNLWTINGKDVASVNTATGRSDRAQQILCVCFSQLNEWDNQNVVMTGSSDGVVRMWSTDYVQVPVDRGSGKPHGPEEEEASENHENDAPSEGTEGVSSSQQEESKAEQIVRRMSLADTENMKNTQEDLLQHRAMGCLPKSGSDSSLSEHDHEWSEGAAGNQDEESPKELESLSERDEDDEDPEGSPKGDTGADTRRRRERFKKRSARIRHTSVPGSPASRGGSASEEGAAASTEDPEKGKGVALSHGGIQRCSTVGTASEIASHEEEGKASLRMSKSDTSLADSYVMVDETDVPLEASDAADIVRKYSRKRRKLLREGFRWQCQLVFRSKLTMHTAFDRKDNSEPAAVTALAVSKDHKIVYVGDARGRVFNWSVTDRPGRAMADHWVKDEGGDSCVACGVRFSFAERRHHCRNCGQLFCSRCSRFECEINRLRILKPVRVCQACYNILKAQQASEVLVSTTPLSSSS